MSRKPLISRRLRIVGLIGLIFAGCAVGYVSLFLSRPIGSGPAGPEVPAEPFESVWSDRPVVLLGIGDSITAGLGARSPSHSYFNRLIENPADEFSDMRGRTYVASCPISNIRILLSPDQRHFSM